ncbi:MAG: class II glutamine amidotransferase [Lachnospiraceae bacterium]|nr:class II glutamine amidotransferase [Lachnospiraceae bacterium]
MCELFGVCSAQPLDVNEYLKEFYSHSDSNPDGWGLAVLDGIEASIEKEPLRANRSAYLRERLSVPVSERTVLAHIRRASIGSIEYRNCHPFTGKDYLGRRWTLIHNGTIFEYSPLNHLFYSQAGGTDSERIFLFLLERINQEIRAAGPLDASGRFRILDEMVCRMAPGNRLNLLIYDGECFYVHTNYANSLYCLQKEGQVIFSTKPLGRENWELVAMTTLLAYKDGELLYRGTDHGAEYIDNTEDTKYLYQIYSEL